MRMLTDAERLCLDPHHVHTNVASWPNSEELWRTCENLAAEGMLTLVDTEDVWHWEPTARGALEFRLDDLLRQAAP